MPTRRTIAAAELALALSPLSLTRPRAAPTNISPFRVVDDPAVLGLLADWCPDPASRRAILATTPHALYRFS